MSACDVPLAKWRSIVKMAGFIAALLSALLTRKECSDKT